ncbi:MAG: hypothetical protein KJ626_12210 [Verrucomicrobia bacterium]|nr:hypothetical protein [Verrucomicrobiota bacterium]
MKIMKNIPHRRKKVSAFLTLICLTAGLWAAGKLVTSFPEKQKGLVVPLLTLGNGVLQAVLFFKAWFALIALQVFLLLAVIGLCFVDLIQFHYAPGIYLNLGILTLLLVLLLREYVKVKKGPGFDQ